VNGTELVGRVAASLGVFDGVHRGHRAVVRALRSVAREVEASSLVVTFDPHPAQILRPDSAPLLLTTAPERVRLLRREGVDAVHVVRFDRATADLSPQEFLARMLPEGAELRALVIGHDFRMGKGRAAGYEELVEIGRVDGFRVERVDPTSEDGGPVSSSRIRERVAAGDVAEAAEMLGRPYGIEGKVVSGRGIGRTLDFPTANVDVEDERKLLPALGVYAAFVRLGLSDDPRWAVVNRGVRPTFGPTDPVLEVHLPGFEGDLVGQTLTLELIDRIRPEVRFEGPEALADQIRKDLEAARRILGIPA
jgi:riboflavin kinase/FMN adenylyltransferase